MATSYGVGDKGILRVVVKDSRASARLAQTVSLALGLVIATAGAAQDAAPPVNSTATLNLPQNPQLF
ncbi:MAG TPA: hypothetical protein VFT40_07180, partial [Sphingomicrobium sp.]|nr:hypothetical protein [Sphingomicrobium sp.]